MCLFAVSVHETVSFCTAIPLETKKKNVLNIAILYLNIDFKRSGGVILYYHKNIRITKTCLYNFDLLKPHFYIVKLGFTGVYIIFLISAQKHRLWYSLEPTRRGGSNEYPQSMF